MQLLTKEPNAGNNPHHEPCNPADSGENTSRNLFQERLIRSDLQRDFSRISTKQIVSRILGIDHVSSGNVSPIYRVGQSYWNVCVLIAEGNSFNAIVSSLEVEQFVCSNECVVIIHYYDWIVASYWDEIQYHNLSCIIGTHDKDFECVANSMVQRIVSFDAIEVGCIRRNKCVVAGNQVINVHPSITWRGQGVGSTCLLSWENYADKHQEKNSQEFTFHLVTQTVEQPTFYTLLESSYKPETLQNRGEKYLSSEENWIP